MFFDISIAFLPFIFYVKNSIFSVFKNFFTTISYLFVQYGNRLYVLFYFSVIFFDTKVLFST